MGREKGFQCSERGTVAITLQPSNSDDVIGEIEVSRFSGEIRRDRRRVGEALRNPFDYGNSTEKGKRAYEGMVQSHKAFQLPRPQINNAESIIEFLMKMGWEYNNAKADRIRLIIARSNRYDRENPD